MKEISENTAWTDELPSTPGFYWNYDGRSKEVYQIINAVGGLCACRALTGYRQVVSLVGGKWYGPLVEP